MEGLEREPCLLREVFLVVARKGLEEQKGQRIMELNLHQGSLLLG